jgi:hypothetical protein
VWVGERINAKHWKHLSFDTIFFHKKADIQIGQSEHEHSNSRKNEGSKNEENFKNFIDS